MLRYALSIMLFACCMCSTDNVVASKIQQQSQNIFDELNKYEDLIEETEVVATQVKEAKISAPVQCALQIGSWFFVQYHIMSQKIAAWCAVLVNGSEENDDE
jgi:hypothetical protein